MFNNIKSNIMSKEIKQSLINKEKELNKYFEKYSFEFSIISRDYKTHFRDDKKKRWVFTVKFTNGDKSTVFDFGQSYAAGDKLPSMFDILSVCQLRPIGSFNDFCIDFGYNNSDKQDLDLYHKVLIQYNELVWVFGDYLNDIISIIENDYI